MRVVCTYVNGLVFGMNTLTVTHVFRISRAHRKKGERRNWCLR